MKNQKIEPWAFWADKRKFKVEINPKQGMIVKGNATLDYKFRYTKPVPVKPGDVFQAAEGGLLLNGKLVPRNIIPPKGKTIYNVCWVAKRLRVAIFKERHRVYDHKTKKYLNKWDEPYWVACDLRSYQIGCHEDLLTALRSLIVQCVITNESAKDEIKEKGRVIRGRHALLTKEEVKEMEEKARRTGIILDGIEVPDKCDWKGGEKYDS